MKKTTRDPEKALRLLGLATRAGKTASGAVACEKAIARGAAAMVLIAEDAAKTTKEKTMALCRKAGIPSLVTGTGKTIGQYTGNQTHMTTAVLDAGMARKIQELLSDADQSME